MNECMHIGLDVHKDTIAVAVLRPVTGEIDERVIPNAPEAVRKLLSRHQRERQWADPSVPAEADEHGASDASLSRGDRAQAQHATEEAAELPDTGGVLCTDRIDRASRGRASAALQT